MSYFDINRYQNFSPQSFSPQNFSPQNFSPKINTQFLQNFETPSIITPEQLISLQTTIAPKLTTSNLTPIKLQTTLRFKPFRQIIKQDVEEIKEIEEIEEKQDVQIEEIKEIRENMLDKDIEENILEKLTEKALSKINEDKDLGVDKYEDLYKSLDMENLGVKMRSITNQNFDNWTKDHIISDLIEYKRFKIMTENKYIEDLNKYYINENIDTLLSIYNNVKNTELKETDKIIEELINLSKELLHEHKKDIKKLYKEYMKTSYTDLKLLFEQIPKPKFLPPNLTSDDIRRLLINNYKNNILQQHKLLPKEVIPKEVITLNTPSRLPIPLSRQPISQQRLPIPLSRQPISQQRLPTPLSRQPISQQRLTIPSKTLKIPIPKILPMNFSNLSTYLSANDNINLSADKKSDLINSIKYYESLGIDQLQNITKLSLSKREIIQKLISEEKLNKDIIYDNGKY